VKAQPCARESELWAALAAGRWPGTADAELRSHVGACAACRELALVAESVARDARDLRRDAAPPSSAVVWWRAQMRARQEAARAADRPITIVQALAIACAAGLLLGLAGSVAASLRGSSALVSALSTSLAAAVNQLALLDFTSSWVLLLVGLTLIVTPVAIYAIVAED
jgi:hypothetical protein